MYRSKKRREQLQTSVTSLSGEGDMELDTGMASEEPDLDVFVEQRTWMSNVESSHSLALSNRDEGDNVASSIVSIPLNSLHEATGDDSIAEIDNDEEDDDAELKEVKVVQPTTTVQQLLKLPQQTQAAQPSLLVKRIPCQRSAQDSKEFKAMTFVPSTRFLGSELNENDWIASDDGLFVGAPLPVSSRNLNRLKNRIWREAGDASPWFCDNGNLIISSPFRPYPLELCQDLDEMMQRLVIFRPAEINQVQSFHHRQLDPYSRYEMTLEIDVIRFFHHPLFSKEHVLAEKLKTTFTTYAKRLEENQSERFEQRLKALRDTVRHTKNMASSAQDQKTFSQLQKRLAKYRTEMDHVRTERDESFRMDKLAMKAVLDTWTKLKKLRQEQQYCSTEVQLKILKLDVNKIREKEIWQEEIEEEFKDLEEAFQANFDRQMRVYRRKLRRWNKGHHHHRVPAEKPFEGVGGDAESSGNESTTVNKPIPPSPFHEARVRAEIKEKFSELKRLPGEPKLILELERQAITPTEKLPSNASGEVRRRKSVDSSKIQIRIWFNMKTTYSSEKRSHSADFSVPVQVALKLPIHEVPECLHLELRQDSRSLHVIQLPIPDSTTAFDRTTPEILNFSTSEDEVIKIGHGGVGAGTKFTILSDTYDGLPVTGDLTMRLGWSTGPDGALLCPKGLDDIQTNQLRSYTPKFDPGTDKWTVPDSEPDPNDPRTMHLHPEKSHERDEFAVESKPTLGADEFCDMSEIENSRRLRLLFLRDQGVPEFRNMKMIPASESEVSPDVFEEYEKRLASEATKNGGEIWKDVQENQQDFNEWDRLQPIRDLRTRLLESFEKQAKQITFEDVVFEEQIPDIGTLGLNIMSIFQPKRPLRPIRKERKKIQTTLFLHTQIELVVNIVRAINLPLRKDSHTQTLTTEALTGVSLSRKGAGTGIWAYGVVKPFIEVWFQRKLSRTTTALGPDPTWNQELQIPLTLEKEDYSESTPKLSRLEEDIYLQVYDEVAIDLLEDERRRETDIHQRLEKRWLGCIRIPFATLYRSGRIEGTFPLNCPPILLGYEGKGSEGITEAYLTLFITLQPAISPPPISNELCSVTGESIEMLEHVKAWMKELEKFGKIVKPFVLTPSGDTVLAPRYLTPIEPPEELFPSDEELSLLDKMKILAHYVSLFPSLRSSCFNAYQHTLWFTSDVFVNTPGGGREDHSILLGCFFLHLGLKTFIVQGESIDGPTTQLLTLFKKSEDFGTMSKQPLLWNPTTGTHARATHAHSALQSVSTAIGQYNMWGNISTKQRPDELDWEIEKSKDWLPLFPKPITEAKLPRLQMNPITFSESDEMEGNRLSQKIERHLRESFMKWRQSRTTWNRYSSTKLRNLLPLLEQRRIDSSPSLVQDEHLGELKEIAKSFEMTGFPLHQSYSTLDSIIETVYSTGLHTIDTPDVQFALGAYVKSYPASIFSLWVYIAALHPIK